MKLYPLIAKHYDDIFPLDPQTLEFLLNNFEKGKTLDLGCATGEYSLGLSRKGFETLGIDLDHEMIDLSLEKAKKYFLLSRFLIGNFLDVVYVNQYKNIFCIGNTLAHVSSLEEVKKSIQHIYDSLVIGGTFIVQNINYDRILKHQITELPTIQRNGVSFERKYQFEEDKIRFMTTLKTADSIDKAETLLLPIKSSDLLDILKEMGFKDFKTYGGFDGSKYEKNKSFHFVVVAKK